MDWAYYIVLLAVLVVGWLINAATLPGLWLMLIATGIYAWVTRGAHAGWWTLGVLLAMALVAEVVEFFAGQVGAKKAGGTKRAAWGAVIGAIVGGIFLTGLIPILVVGTVVGVCLGAFIGAALAQVTKKGDVGHSMRVGAGAAAGKFAGIVAKLGFGLVMLVIAAVAAWPGIGRGKTGATPGAGGGTTMPATTTTTRGATTVPATNSR